MDVDRRAFFQGLKPGQALIRPPYSASEIEFFDACTGCGDCIAACPEGIIVSGGHNRPHIDFQLGHCTFCQACAEGCQPQALSISDHNSAQPWDLKAIVSTKCLEFSGVSCRACEFECGEGALRFRPVAGSRTELRVDLAACTGCGECIGPCPQDALSIQPTETTQVPTGANARPSLTATTNKECTQC